MLRYVRFKIIEVNDKSYVSQENFKTGVVTYPQENTFYVAKSVPVTIQPGKRYMIVIEGITSETINEGTLEFDILFKSPEFNLEQVDQVEPLEYFDKYAPSKYGVLFRERLFVRSIHSLKLT